jgi:hypothetical protein
LTRAFAACNARMVNLLPVRLVLPNLFRGVCTKPMDKSKSMFVLVHGAWHGGCCWSRLILHLEIAGHRALAVTLTGQRDHAHLINPSIDLATHVADALSMLATLRRRSMKSGALWLFGAIKKRPGRTQYRTRRCPACRISDDRRASRVQLVELNRRSFFIGSTGEVHVACS